MFVEKLERKELRWAVPENYDIDKVNYKSNGVEIWGSLVPEKDDDDERNREQEKFIYFKLSDFTILPEDYRTNSDYQKHMSRMFGKSYEKALENYKNLCTRSTKPLKEKTSRETSFVEFF